MADTKISALSAGTAAPGDEIPVNRSGSNFKITAGDILKINGGTVTANSPVLDLTQTWNNAAVTFTGLKFNATDTASAAGSLLMDLQVAGSSLFSVTKAGRVKTEMVGSSVTSSFSGILFTSNIHTYYVNNSIAADLRVNQWTIGGVLGNGATLSADAADTLAQRRTTNAQTFRLYGTYTDASNYRRLASTSTTAGAFTLSAEGLGTGATGNTLAFATDGTTRLTIAATGVATYSLAGGNGPIFVFNNTNSVGGYSSMVDMFSPNMSNGDIQTTLRFGRSITTNNAGYLAFKYVSSGSANNSLSFALHAGAEWFFTAGGLLQFGGTTSSFPSLKRSGAGLISRLADDSADAAFTASTLTASSSAANTSAIASTGYSLTGSSAVSMVDLAGTWNTTGTPTAIKLNVTDTASNAASLLMDLQVGGASRISARKDGRLSLVDITTNTGSGDLILYREGTASARFGTARFSCASEFGLSNNNPSAPDLLLARDAANTFAQRNSTNAQTFRLYNTYTDASNYERGFLRWNANVLEIGAEAGGTGSARALSLNAGAVLAGTSNAAGPALTIKGGQGTGTGAGGSIVFQVAPAGSSGTAQNALADALTIASDKSAAFGGSISTPTTGTISLGALLYISSTKAMLYTSNPLCWGPGNAGSGAYDTSLSRNNAGIVQVGTSSANASGSLIATGLTATSTLTVSAANIVTDGTTGTKIGTATTQKLAFWNATPIVQPTTAIAEAAFVENSGGTAVNVDSTFDGYTLQQIAKALRDAGLLA